MDKIKDGLLGILNSEDVEYIYIDCGQGDKLRVTEIGYDKNGKSLQLKIDKRDLAWIMMDVKHPIKLISDSVPKDEEKSETSITSGLEYGSELISKIKHKLKRMFTSDLNKNIIEGDKLSYKKR